MPFWKKKEEQNRPQIDDYIATPFPGECEWFVDPHTRTDYWEGPPKNYEEARGRDARLAEVTKRRRKLEQDWERFEDMTHKEQIQLRNEAWTITEDWYNLTGEQAYCLKIFHRLHRWEFEPVKR